jgi:hypothetical protein
MSWQPVSWHEITVQAKGVPLGARLEPVIRWTSTVSWQLVGFVAAFLTPCALVEASLGTWRFGADMGWTDGFFIVRGLLSHWQVWFALAILTQAASVTLNRRLIAHEQSVQEGK